MPVLELYGDIGEMWWDPENEITGKSVSRWLKENAQGAEQITVRVNSFGGYVHEGVAIHNLLSQHSARVLMEVIGFALSAASVVVMAGDEIVMLPGSMMMIHPAWGFCMGNADDMDTEAKALRSMSDASAAIYAARTGKTKEECLDLMDAKTWFQPEEALAAGFCDKLGAAKTKAQQALPRESRANQKWLQSFKRAPSAFTQLLQSREAAARQHAPAQPRRSMTHTPRTAFSELASGGRRPRIGDL